MVTETVIPLILGLGLMLIVWWSVVPQWTHGRRRSGLSNLLSDAGLTHVTSKRLIGSTLCLSVTAGLLVYVMSASLAVAVAIAVMVSPLPIGWVRHVKRRRQIELRQVWPDAIEHLASGIRAGLALPEAVSQYPATVRSVVSQPASQWTFATPD